MRVLATLEYTASAVGIDELVIVATDGMNVAEGSVLICVDLQGGFGVWGGWWRCNRRGQ